MFIPLTGHRLISSWSAKRQAVTSPSKAPRWCTCCNVQKINSEKCTGTGEKEGASDRWRVSDFCSTLLFSWCPYSESGTGLRRKCCVSYCLYSLHAHISLIFFVSSAQPRKWEIHASRNKLHSLQMPQAHFCKIYHSYIICSRHLVLIQKQKFVFQVWVHDCTKIQDIEMFKRKLLF